MIAAQDVKIVKEIGKLALLKINLFPFASSASLAVKDL